MMSHVFQLYTNGATVILSEPQSLYLPKLESLESGIEPVGLWRTD